MSGRPETLAEAMIPVAARLVVLVHGDGGRDEVAALLSELTPDEEWALFVVLAAMVNPDRSLGAALGWISWDEHGDPLAPGLAETRTIRDAAEGAEPGSPAGECVDEVVVERALAGVRVEANDAERLAVIEAAARDEDVSPTTVAMGLGLKANTTQKAIQRTRERSIHKEAS